MTITRELVKYKDSGAQLLDPLKEQGMDSCSSPKPLTNEVMQGN